MGQTLQNHLWKISERSLSFIKLFAEIRIFFSKIHLKQLLQHLQLNFSKKIKLLEFYKISPNFQSRQKGDVLNMKFFHLKFWIEEVVFDPTQSNLSNILRAISHTLCFARDEKSLAICLTKSPKTFSGLKFPFFLAAFSEFFGPKFKAIYRLSRNYALLNLTSHSPTKTTYPSQKLVSQNSTIRSVSYAVGIKRVINLSKLKTFAKKLKMSHLESMLVELHGE